VTRPRGGREPAPADLRRLLDAGPTAPRLEALFQAIVEQIAAWAGFSIVSIEVLDAAHTDVVPVAAVGLPSDEPVSGSVALTGEALVDQDVLVRPTRVSPALLQSGARTVVSVPIGGNVIGALTLADSHVVELPDRFVDLVRIVAATIGRLLESKSREDELENATMRLGLLAGAATSVRARASVDELISLAVDRLAAGFAPGRASYATIDTSGLLRIVRSTSPDERYTLEADLTALPGRLASLRAGGALVVDDVAADPEIDLLVQSITDEAKAVLWVPLRQSEELVGLLCLDLTEPHAWSAHEVAAVSDLAEFLSIALADASASERLREAEAEYRRLVEEIPIVTYVDRQDEWSSAIFRSPQVVPLLGYTIEEWLEDRELFAKILHPDDRERVLQEIRDDAEHWRSEYRLIAKDGRVVWVQDEAHQRRNADGELEPARGYLLDITGRKELEERLRQAHRLEGVGRLAGGIAHEFNNLNAVVAGHAELLAQEVGSDSPLYPQLEEIRTAAARSAKLIEQLLTFSRRGVLAPARHDLNDLVSSVDALLRGAAGRDVEALFELAPEPLVVLVDAAQMQSALLELADNAYESMPDGGRLRIQTAAADGDAILTVSDTGVGMEDETRRHVFDPFFTTKGIGRGTGLGLASVHGTIERSGGRIEVDSAPGAGTTFRIWLPLDPS